MDFMPLLWFCSNYSGAEIFMDTLLQTTEWQGLIWVLLAFVMIKEIKKHGREIFDNNLTAFDKDRLLRLAYTFIFPIVVFFHECGHAVATVWAHGVVKEFHYGAWIGYVVAGGNFTPAQDLVITLSGNVVQIIFGFVFLFFALISRSPAMVALWVYSGILSIGGTVVLYTLLSVLTGDGDWAMIYRTPLKEAFNAIAFVHVLLALLMFYLVNGKGPKLWFYKRTHPDWIKRLEVLQKELAKDPSLKNRLLLATQYVIASDFNSARKYLQESSDSDYRTLLLSAYIEEQENRPSKALTLCQKVLDSYDDPIVRSQALCFYANVLPKVPRQENVLERSRQYLDQAIASTPDYGDPYFYKAVNLAQAGDIESAQEILSKLLADSENLNLKWINGGLADEVLPELNSLTTGKRQSRP